MRSDRCNRKAVRKMLIHRVIGVQHGHFSAVTNSVQQIFLMCTWICQHQWNYDEGHVVNRERTADRKKFDSEIPNLKEEGKEIISLRVVWLMNLQILTRGFSLRKIREKNISSDVNLDKNSTKHLRRNHSAIFTLQIKIRSLYLNRAQSGYAPCWLHMNWQLRLTVPAQLYSIWPWEVLIHSCYS